MSLPTRRAILLQAGTVAVAAPAVFSAARAQAPSPQLPKLPSLSASDALLLRPGDGHFADYQASFNIRTALTPQLRALCKTAHAVGVMVDWCRSNTLPFAVRCGGHSYEGLSQSLSVVIDMRLNDTIAVDGKSSTATIGAGASLGTLYTTIARYGLAFTGGSCPTVGVSGHLLGGGYGYLARPYGLACDALLSADVVDPQGRLVHASAKENADLYWACRGGGGGSFGIATRYAVQLQKIAAVLVFNVKWPALSIAKAAAVMKAWQAWAPSAPAAIDASLVIQKNTDGSIALRCSGQSVGTSAQLRSQLKALPASPTITPMSFIDAVKHYAGSWSYPTQTMKGKSDYATAPLSDAGLIALMSGVSRSSGTYVICDAYGGAVGKPKADATAFVHRGGTLFCIQYAQVWSRAADTPKRLDEIRQFYATMRPYVSGGAYVNYCDLDLPDYASAYWGANLPRLKQIKAAFDPGNVFRHAQSVPLA